METTQVAKLDLSLLTGKLSGDTVDRIRQLLSVYQALPFDALVSLSGKSAPSVSDALNNASKDGWIELEKYPNPLTKKEQSWYRIKRGTAEQKIRLQGLRISHHTVSQIQAFVDIRDIPSFAWIPQIGIGTQDDFQREKIWSWIRELFLGFNSSLTGRFLPMTTNVILAYWDDKAIHIGDMPAPRHEFKKLGDSEDFVAIEISVPKGGFWPWEMPMVVLDGQQRLTAGLGVTEPLIIPIHMTYEPDAATRAKLFLVANATKNVASGQKDEVALQIETLGGKEILTTKERKGASIEAIVRMINETPGAMNGRVAVEDNPSGDISSRVFHDVLGKIYPKQYIFSAFFDSAGAYRPDLRETLAKSITAFFDHVESVFPRGWNGKKHQLNKAFGISVMLQLFAYLIASFEKASDIGNPAAWDDKMHKRLEQLRKDGFDWDREDLFSVGGWTYAKVADAIQKIQTVVNENRAAYE